MMFPKKLSDYETVTGSKSYLDAGGVILKCLGAIDKPSNSGNPMLTLHLDVAHGQHKDHFANFASDRDLKFWPLCYYQVYSDEKQIGRFKGMIKSFSDSNPGFITKSTVEGESFDEKILEGLEIGACLQFEEYRKKDGGIGKSLRISYLCDTQKVKDGKIEVPPVKKLKGADSDKDLSKAFSAPKEEDLPF